MVNKDEYNYPIVINLSPGAWCDGHWILEEIDVKETHNHKYLVKCHPKDVWLGRGIVKPKGYQELEKTYETLLERGMRKPIPGTKHREIILYIPDNPNNFPQGLIDLAPVIYMSMMKEIESAQWSLEEMIYEKKLDQTKAQQFLSNDVTNDWIRKKLMKQIESMTNIVTQRVSEKVGVGSSQRPLNQQQLK